MNGIKEAILNREQYYLDSINPSLNICKIAGSPLGVKRSELFSINLSKANRGKKYIKTTLGVNIISKIVAPEARLKMSSRAGGVSVKIFDKSNNLINQFPSITKAAKFIGVDNKTIRSIFNTGISYDNYTYAFEIKDIRVWVYNYNHELINIIGNAQKASIFYNISYSTISRYIKSGKLYKKKFYFYNVNYKNNPYFNNND